MTEKQALATEQVRRLQADKRKLQAELRKVYSQLFTQRDFEKLIRSVCAGPTHNASPAGKPPRVAKAKSAVGAETVPVLMLSDIHFDEVVEPAAIGGLNAFNREICVNRLYKTVQNFLDYKQVLGKPGGQSVLAILGDLLSGAIHDELTETNEAPLIQSILYLKAVLRDVILMCADGADLLTVVCTIGNHDRVSQDKRFKQECFHSYAYLVYRLLAQELAHDKRIEFVIPEGLDAHLVIAGNAHLFTHGDQLKGGGADPTSSLTRSGLRKIAHARKNGYHAQTIAFGHWHSSFSHVTSSRDDKLAVISNGSIKGLDEYANRFMFNPESPCQMAWTVSEKHGVQNVTHLDCE